MKKDMKKKKNPLETKRKWYKDKKIISSGEMVLMENAKKK